jgi:SAM-dependent methyltransferase
LAWAYYEKHPDLFTVAGQFLHIAPEAELAKYLKFRCRQVGMDYRHGDLRDRRHFLDVRQLPQSDNSVDVLLACHVLNMVSEDMCAMREIHRVLKPGGTAVLPVPVLPEGRDTVEVSSTSTAEERLAAFDDPAMYRKYAAKDYVQRLANAGLSVAVFGPMDLPASDVTLWGIGDERVHVAAKRG